MGENKLVSIKYFNSQSEKFKAIEDTIEEQNQIFKNFVVILENKEESQKFFDQYKNLTQKKAILINDFNKFQESMGKIQSLMHHDFIIVTTKEGGTGVDFRGTEISHVIIAFEYLNFSELI